MNLVYYGYPDNFGSNVMVFEKIPQDIDGEIALFLSEEDMKHDMFKVEYNRETGEASAEKYKGTPNLTIFKDTLELVAPFRNSFSAVQYIKFLETKINEFDERDDAAFHDVAESEEV